MGTELIPQDEGQLQYAPETVIEEAAKAAKALTGVVMRKKKPVLINNEQYLEYEDWQTLGQFYGAAVTTGDAEPVEIDGVKGMRAQAKLINMKTGIIIGGAEAYCMRDESNWTDKPLFQLGSMAQTRAGAKALRNRLAWIAVLAGYRPTPAEEMDGSLAKEHWCDIHNVPFHKFTKGTSTWWSHKLEDGTYCNETKAEKTPTLQAKESAPKEAQLGSQAIGFDEVWLKDSLKKVKWSDTTVKSYLKNIYKVDTEGTVIDVVARLTDEQQGNFFKEIQDRLDIR